MALAEAWPTRSCHTLGLELSSGKFAQMAKEAREETTAQDDIGHVGMEWLACEVQPRVARLLPPSFDGRRQVSYCGVK
jgi:hypothetical protein